MDIGEYLDDGLVVFLDVKTKEETIHTLIESLDAAGKLKDKKLFKKAILDREEIDSTGTGLGLAIPHAKMSDYDRFFIAIGIHLGHGIEWQSPDGSRVHLIFMIGGPNNSQTEYLQILSQLTRLMQNPVLRQDLLKASCSEQVISLLKGY